MAIRVDPGGADWLPQSRDLELMDMSPERAQKARLDRIMTASTHGEDLTPFLSLQPAPEPPWYERLLTPRPWEERAVDAIFGSDGGTPTPLPSPSRRPTIQGPTLDLSAIDELGLTRPEASAAPEVQQRYQSLRNVITPIRATRAPAQPTPRQARSAPAPKPSRTEQAFNFAKALGFVGEEAATPEYAEAVTRAFAKMTKGMSVAKLLGASRRAKAQEEFQRLIEQEAAKMRSTQGPASRPPIQPS